MDRRSPVDKPVRRRTGDEELKHQQPSGVDQRSKARRVRLTLRPCTAGRAS